jgi:DNA-directed RNA polymerase subunit beta'
MKSNEEILDLEKTLLKLENLHASFDYLRITIASPKRIKSWSQRTLPTGEVIGEVLKPETINFRTHQPELNGLFCEKIFGPIKNWKCKCGKYNGFLLDKICEECQVEIIEARVRRYRMGYIELTCPVAHLWYLKGVPNYLAILLKCFDEALKLTHIDQIIYFKEIDPENSLELFLYPETKNELQPFLERNQTFLNSSEEAETNSFSKYFKPLRQKKRQGAEIIKAALENINLKNEIKKARSFVDDLTLNNLGTALLPDKSLIRRIRILESFLATKINPSWMILTTLPVLPPNLRPLLELENGRLVAADVNEIYRLIITRNQRLFDLLYNFISPELITTHGRKLLQEGVDSLIDNARLPKEKMFCLNNKALKSLTEILEGKQGRFRQSLLGKRVDYSGRSVIIVGPNLRLNQCGLPYEMVVELFQPYLINELLKTKIKAPSHNTKLAHVIIKKNKPFIWSLLEKLTKKHSILLNRAPTLHRFGIQAFDPVLILGQAIHLHPLVCTGFNADFDGDQMAVHLPLYEVSQLETRTLMRPCYNVLSPSNGEVILKPTQDMVIGCYYLTLMITKASSIIKKWFANETDALLAFYQKKITIHTPILVRYSLSNFEVKVDNGKIKFLEKITALKENEKEIFISKIFQFGKNENKYFLLTNIGILIAQKKNKKTYQITDLFLETTAGRLIFSINFKKALTLDQ